MLNKKRSKLPTVVLVSVLFLTSLALPFIQVGASTAITTFSTGANEVSITYSAPGKDTSAALAMPKGCTVVDASMTFEGKPLRMTTPGTVDFDYNDTVNNMFWGGSTSENVSTSIKDPSQWQSQGNNASQLAIEDDVRLTTSAAKGMAYAYQQFSFKVDVAEITDITIEWNGYAYWGGGGASVIMNGVGAQLYIWNNKTLAWEELGHYNGGHPNAYNGIDVWIKKTISGTALESYLYNGELSVVGSNWYTNPTASTQISSDFIKARVTGKGMSYPADVTVDVGNDGTDDWTHAGVLRGDESFTGVDFTGALQTIIDKQGVGHGSFDVPLAISSSARGIIRAWNVSIHVDPYVNKAPVPLAIPSTFHFPEDTTAKDLINMTKYFADDQDKNTDLTYAVVNESAPTHIHATVSAHGLMTFTTPTKDWFGNETFTVSAKDTDGLTTTSQAVNVRVDPVPDAPVLKPVGALNFTRDKPGTIVLQATDPDTLWGGTDPLSYSAVFETGTSFFNLNSKSGMAAFTPTEDNVGDFTVTFTVTDSHGLTDSETVQIKVANVNYPPVWVPNGKQVIDEGKPYELQLKANDVDKADKDNLAYTVSFTDGGTMFTMGTDGKIGFTPAKAMVGTHHVRFTVTDTAGHKVNQDVVFEVRNVNSLPVIKAIADQKVNRNTPFSQKVEVTDEDMGIVQESLTYSVESSIVKIDEETGWINFTPTTSQVGKYVVKVTVTDLAGATATRSFNLEVVLNNSLPEAKILVAGNKTSVKEGSSVTLTAQASDKDNDPMTYKWTENGKELGTEQELTMAKIKAGKHTVTLTVSDPYSNTTVTQDIKVSKKGVTPGFDGVAVMVALAGIAAVIVVRRKR